MVLYNTLSRKKEEFVPQEENVVRMYACGPTVYNLITIGNARFYVVFDMIRKYLEYRGYQVIYVQNITDVDDKIIQRANEEGVSADVIAERYMNDAKQDAAALGVKEPTYAPRVTEEMDSIIEMIEVLVRKGFAYEVNGTVYYDTAKFPVYGKLSGKNISDLEAGARVEVDREKRNTPDFVLWKPAKPSEPKWHSPWGDGRPGWHIECSAMAKKYLGDTLDIHGGGEDLIFPHHENEIAQSEAANGKPFVSYWLHNAFINVDNRKMSKSLGNFFTLREVAEKFSYNVIRFFLLSAHYRSPVSFSELLLHSAKSGLERITNCRLHLEYIIGTASAEFNDDEKSLLAHAAKFKQDFIKSMDDDFNTADAISDIFELVKFANINVTEGSSADLARGILTLLDHLCGVLGISLSDGTEGVDTAEIEQLIEQRRQARQNKDWAAADKIRDRLNEMGVVLEDTPSGVKYRMK